MPNPNDSVQRDAMLHRMEMATPGGPRFPTFDPAQAFASSMRAAENWQAQQTVIEPSPTAREPSIVRQHLNEGKQVELTLNGKPLVTLGPPPAGSVLAACLRDTAKDTFSVVESAVKPYSNVGIFGAHPDSQWLAAHHARPLNVISAVAKAIDDRPVTADQLAAARAVLPGVDAELVRLAIEAARQAQVEGR